MSCKQWPEKFGVGAGREKDGSQTAPARPGACTLPGSVAGGVLQGDPRQAELLMTQRHVGTQQDLCVCQLTPLTSHCSFQQKVTSH